MLYTIYINISQSMMYYDGVKKTFFLPHIFKESDGRVNLPSLFFCADSDEYFKLYMANTAILVI
ncbi:hypothetical protein DW979_00975 [Eubacterium sp. AM49-13BH]|nr:hypothetical protein DW979_00975 [Eubacterium sp. AM49-13BH]